MRRATSSLTLLVDHSPVHWSSVLLKVCACQACVRACVQWSRVECAIKMHCRMPQLMLCAPPPTPPTQQWLLAVLKEVTAARRTPPGSIDSSVKFWVSNSVTQPLCALLRTCVDVLSVTALIALHPLVVTCTICCPPPLPSLADCPWMPHLSRHTHWSSCWDRPSSQSGSLHTSCVCRARVAIAKPRPLSPTHSLQVTPPGSAGALPAADLGLRTSSAGCLCLPAAGVCGPDLWACHRREVPSAAVPGELCPLGGHWGGVDCKPLPPGCAEGRGRGRHGCHDQLLPPPDAAQPTNTAHGGTSTAQGL